MSPCSVGSRIAMYTAPTARKDAWSGAKAPGTEAFSTAVRTGPIAGTRGDPARNAEPVCRSGPAMPSTAGTAADRSGAIPGATAGWKRKWAGSAGSSAARTIRIAITLETCSNPGRDEVTVRSFGTRWIAEYRRSSQRALMNMDQAAMYERRQPAPARLCGAMKTGTLRRQ